MNTHAVPSHPRSIAFCITELDVGGAERCLVELVTRLDRRRFSPIVYCLATPPSSDELTTRLGSADVPVHFLGVTRPRHFTRAVRRLTSLLREQRPELLQTFLFHANIVGRLAARRAGVPHTVCGIRVAEPSRRWRLWLDRLTSGHVDRYVCVSRAVAQFSQTEGHLPADRLTVIANGIDPQIYDVSPVEVAKVGVAPGRRMLAFVGRLEAQKRVDWLLHLMPRVFAALPDHDLVLAGEGPLRSQLEAAAHTLGIAARVHFLGWRADIPAILRASDLLLLPSAWEGMPNVVLEAMAAGLPVVATDVEGVAELLGPDAAQQMVSKSNPDQFAERVMKMARNNEQRRWLGLNNSARARECFSNAAMVTRYQNLYDEVLLRAPGSES